MLSVIYTLDFITMQYKRRYIPDHSVWMAYGVNKGGVYAVEHCTNAVTLSDHAYRAFKSREDIEDVEYIIARDELDAFRKARLSAQEVIPRWVVILGDTPFVFRARVQTGDWPDRKASSALRTYYLRARDEFEAFMKARKMEAEK